MSRLSENVLTSIVCGCLAGCGPLLFGSPTNPFPLKHHSADQIKADSELTCAELESDLSNTAADLALVNSRLAQYGEPSSTSSTSSAPGGPPVASSQRPEVTKLRAQRDAYQQRRDALASLHHAKGCKTTG